MTEDEIKEYFQKIDQIIEENGHAIQGVGDEYYYTIGLYKRGLEIVTGSIGQNFAAHILNHSVREGELPQPFTAYTSEGFYVIVDGKELPSRYGYVAVHDPELIRVMRNYYCLGWKRKFPDGAVDMVYIAVVSDKNNVLPWEKGYESFDQDYEGFIRNVYLEAHKKLVGQEEQVMENIRKNIRIKQMFDKPSPEK